MPIWRPPAHRYTQVATKLIADTKSPLDRLGIEVVPPT
jgi:hypothetical protein